MAVFQLMTQARYVGTLVSQLSATVIELDVTQDIALLFERVREMTFNKTLDLTAETGVYRGGRLERGACHH